MLSSATRSLGDLVARVLRSLFIWASHRRRLARLAMSSSLTRWVVRRFVAGETLPEVLASLERLRARGFRTTVDILGEEVASVDDARTASDRYLEALDALTGRGLDRNVSLKLTQMGLAVSPSGCGENVRRIVAHAAESGAFVRVDMEDHTRTDATLALLRELHGGGYPNVGVVIQSYLRRSAGDVEELCDARIRVRLCKGAYDEPATVAFGSKGEVDESFRRLATVLLRRGEYPAFATHDERLITFVRQLAAREGIGPDRYEFQMLFGVRRDLQQELVRQGYTVRVYVPFGSEWYPYFMRRLAERPANVLFMARAVLRERRRPPRPFTLPPAPLR